jgi:hypothetical protein
MYLIRNFASQVKMKSHDMNWDGLLNCYTTWFGGSAGSFSDRAILFMIDFQYKKIDWSSWWVLSSWCHEDMIPVWPYPIGIWNCMTWESVASLGTGMVSDGSGGGDCYRIAIWNGFLKNNYYFGIWNVKMLGVACDEKLGRHEDMLVMSVGHSWCVSEITWHE